MTLRTTLAFAIAASVAVPVVVCGLPAGSMGGLAIAEALAASHSHSASARREHRPRVDTGHAARGASPGAASSTRPSSPLASKRTASKRTASLTAGGQAPRTGAAPGSKVTPAKAAPVKAKPPCLRDAIGVMRGSEEARFSLTRCDGSPAPLAVEHLSVLARASVASLPPANVAFLSKRAGKDLAPGVRRVDPRLVDRLQAVVDHFSRDARGARGVSVPPRIVLVSGYRPTSAGSYHAHGKALDLRLDGVSNDELVAFCKMLPDTGCGFYPNSSFVHLDVREAGTGHVTWIDGSGPGESPRYVGAWPPSPSESPKRSGGEAIDPIRQLDSEAPAMPIDEHPSTPRGDDDSASDGAIEETITPGDPTMSSGFETPATTDSE